jgi:hypothetical protein
MSSHPRGGWHLSAIARFQGFSSGSPAAFPHQWSPKTVTTSWWWGEASRAAASAPPSASRIFIILAGEEGEASRGLPSHGLASRFFLRHLGVETILQLCGGGILQPCRGRQTAAAQPGCSIPSSVRATVADRTGGSHNASYAARAVLVFWDGPVLVFVARTEVRTCRCALGRPTLAGAVLVGRWTPPSVLRWWQPEKVSPPTRSSAPSALRASGSLALIAGSRPPQGDTNESLPAVAFALGPSLLLRRSPTSHPESVVPQALRCGGCSYPREWNRSSVCNGTLSVGVCSLRLSGPEHPGILV